MNEWQSITREDTQCLVMSVSKTSGSHRMQRIFNQVLQHDDFI
uniref:Uncharacterized protein n=1 Tax=Anguilla anguilla TaxID=7936 RepID=A0A0E9URV3_ANGAN